jgi:hypothetical protein
VVDDVYHINFHVVVVDDFNYILLIRYVFNLIPIYVNLLDEMVKFIILILDFVIYLSIILIIWIILIIYFYVFKQYDDYMYDFFEFCYLLYFNFVINFSF